MSIPKSKTSPEKPATTPDTGSKQLVYGFDIAKGYLTAKEGSKLNRDAEVSLSNPIALLKSLGKEQVPEELQKRWDNLLDFSEAVYKVTEVDERNFVEGLSGLEKLQANMSVGNIDRDYRGSISDVIKMASTLFYETYALHPHDNQYYSQNIEHMQSISQRQ